MEDGIERSTLNYYCKNDSTKKEYKEDKEDKICLYIFTCKW